MRILVNTLELAPETGIDVHAFDMSRELAKRGHSISVVAQRDGALRREWEAFADEVVVAGDFLHQPVSPAELRRPHEFGSWLAALRRAIANGRRVKADIVYANDAQALLWAYGVSCTRSTPVVCHLHSSIGTPLGRQRQLLASKIAHFIAPSSFIQREWLGGGLSEQQISVVHQAVDPQRFSPPSARDRAEIRDRLKIPAEAFVAIYLGRIVPYKGVDVLIKAWKELDLDPTGGRLLVVGSAYPPGYVEQLHAMAPPTTLFIRPQIDVLSMLHASDVLVLPSLVEEACPRVVIEAMAAGLPAVATRCGGVPEILTGAFESLMFEKSDVVGLAAELASLKDWRSVSPQLGARCQSHVEKNFNLSTAADEVETTLLRTIDGR